MFTYFMCQMPFNVFDPTVHNFRVHALIVAPTLSGGWFSHCCPKAAFVTLPSLHTQVPTSPSLTALAYPETYHMRYTYLFLLSTQICSSCFTFTCVVIAEFQHGPAAYINRAVAPTTPIFQPRHSPPLFYVLSISAHNRIHLLTLASTFLPPTIAAMSWDTGATAGM